MKRLGLIRVLTSANSRLLRLHGQNLQAALPVEVFTRCVSGQPDGVHDDESLARATPKVVALAKELAEEVDGIIISCAADPGLEQTRAAVNIPVTAAGSSAAAVALSIGGKAGVLGTGPAIPQPFARILGTNLIAAEAPHGVRYTTDLMTPTGVEETLRAAQRLVDAGADVIVQACTGLSSMGIAGEIRRRHHLPVIDGVLAAATALLSDDPGYHQHHRPTLKASL